MVLTLHCRCNQGVQVQVAQQRLWWSQDRYGILTTRHRPGVKMVGFEQTHLDVREPVIYVLAEFVREGGTPPPLPP